MQRGSNACQRCTLHPDLATHGRGGSDSANGTEDEVPILLRHERDDVIDEAGATETPCKTGLAEYRSETLPQKRRKEAKVTEYAVLHTSINTNDRECSDELTMTHEEDS